MAKRKAQISLEVMFIIALYVAIFLPLFYYVYVQSADAIKLAKTREALSEIAKTVDYVWAQGPGTQTSIDVWLPAGIRGATIANRTLTLTLSTSHGDTDLFVVTKPTLSGGIPITGGMHRVVINHTTGGVTIV